MQLLTRPLWFLAHCAWSFVALARAAVRGAGHPLVFVHAPDVDASGRDRQMGPLVDRLVVDGRPFTELVFVALDRRFLGTVLRRRRPFVSFALVAVRGWLLSRFVPAGEQRARRRLALRARAARRLLRIVRPSCVLLTDEAGSGRALVRAARSLGIATIAVQHGDFQPDNAQYARAEGDSDAPDVLCVWSEWFADRLRRTSPTYAANGTTRVEVTGRLRYSTGDARSAPEERGLDARVGAAVGERLRVLLVSEPGDAFPASVRPFVDALARDASVALRVQPHPAEERARWSGVALSTDPLDVAVRASDVVIGVRSSALLEALYLGRPAITLAAGATPDPARYATDGALERCDEPDALAELCARARSDAERDAWRARRELVWGADERSPVDTILARCIR